MDNKLNFLVVDDEEGICILLKTILKRFGTVHSFTNAGKALQLFARKNFDIAIIDIRMPDMNGIDLLKEILKINKEMHVIMITAYGCIENAVESIKLGAFDYITKPFGADEIEHIIFKIIERKKLINENIKLKKELSNIYRQDEIIGKSQKMNRVLQMAKKTAKSKYGILITGETGTGKEVLARYIHKQSDRSNCPFIPVQCNLLPVDLFESELFGHKKGSFTGATIDKTGLFEEANTGTIFLDEIGDIAPDIQGKLLRFIQDNEIRRVGDTKYKKLDVRIICATNKNLQSLVKENIFRDDLFFRINAINFHIPPLRERKEDIPLLINYFISMLNESRNEMIEVDNDCLKTLISYHWPGNIRELKNCIETAAVICDDNIITNKDIMNTLNQSSDVVVDAGQSFKEAKAQIVNEFERNYLITRLINSKGNIAAAARDSNIDRKNFFELIKKYNINPDIYK